MGFRVYRNIKGCKGFMGIYGTICEHRGIQKEKRNWKMK